MAAFWLLLYAAAVFAISTSCALAQNAATNVCRRPPAGSTVPEPEDLRSRNGALRVELTYRGFVDANGNVRYCYAYKDGSEAPTLRLKPGDLLVLRLKNEVSLPSQPIERKLHAHTMHGECADGEMTAASTNVHFHGLDVPPVCHQDDVLNTMIQPGDPPFEYRFRIPLDEAPGLYWYHPHVHGLTKTQVLGGASGALIVEGIERANPLLAGLPERVFVIRDQELLNPNAEPVKSDSVPPPIVLRDAEGDILNTGTGGGKPAKDLSINFVPVLYPSYPPAAIKMKPAERQLWRVLNASAITYLDLQMLIDNKPQMVGVVSLDGVPINENGMAGNRIVWESHILLPPAGRVEFVVKGPPADQKASFVTRTVDTGPAGENDPTRPLATIAAAPEASEPRATLAASPAPLARPSSVWLGDVTPVRTRKLYFSEKPRNPNDPNSPTDFYITVEGQEPALFDPNGKVPNIVARQGDVEDWIIENRTQELHAFHIHQIHFILMEWNGVPVDEPFLRDTVNVAYWDGRSRQYPSVKLRMDFRDPNVVGTFVYHCHLLEHEDGGMMGMIRVDPRDGQPSLSRRFIPRGRVLCGARVGQQHGSNTLNAIAKQNGRAPTGF
ncbi:MAG: multicopper oxidase domain-containing protein [Candidatus Acidiferrales bacterium]|jgi:FtsP/CotA-like multicopper oxidase with cupredoxin domain